MAFTLPSLFGPDPNDPYASPVNTKRILLIGGIVAGVIAAVVVVIFLIGSANSAVKQDALTMVARQQTLSQIVTDSQTHVHNADLKLINASATILFASNVFDLKNQLKNQFGTDTPTENIKAKEADKATDTQLSSAALLDKFDSTYRDILLNKIDAILVLASNVTQQTSNTKLKAVIAKYRTDLETIRSQLAALNL